jgi:titin
MQAIRLNASRATALLVVSLLVLAGLVVGPLQAAASGPTTVTQTFAYTGSPATFTVPAGITSLNLTVVGAEGGLGGRDSAGFPPPGGYQGVVSGAISVTPGQVLTVGVGSGGANGAAGAGSATQANWFVGAALGGSNPLGYNGGNGGVAGPQGSSGYGGAGGAASVVQVGTSTIIAGGAGGTGGSGQYAPTLGRLPYSTFTARADATSTVGQNGITVATVCNNAPAPGCDGGASGAGGGGAQGGAQGGVEFGSGTSNEWFGYGGYPGQNSTAGLPGLSALYQWYANNAVAGSVTISYVTGAPGAPTNVTGVAQDGAVALGWNAPLSTGGSDITDYVVQYAPASSPTSWTTFSDGVGTGTSTVVTGLTDGTAYVFQVSAVNSFGTGDPSGASASISPSAPPSAPVISTVTPGDGTLSVAFPAPASGSPIVNYQYQVNGDGNWISAGTATSPVLVTGLVNGTSYSVQVRAVSAIGAGAASAPASGSPVAPPGAPTITSVSTGIGSASVSFTPGYLGGGTATDYQYQLNGGAWVAAGTTASPIAVTGLANGTQYTIKLRAVSPSGTGAASQGSTVTTPDVPGAPSVSSVSTSDGSLAINFTAGSSGGATVTKYQYQLTTNGPWVDAPTMASPILVGGLDNGTTYNVSVRAVNAIGAGAASAPRAATPAAVPSAPTIVGDTVAGSNSQLSAAFTPPASNGGAAITSYQYSTDGGATWRTRDAGTTASPLVISTLSSDGTTPLENGVTYYVELRAVNSVGAGQASAVATGIAATTPDAPVISSVSPAAGSLQVSFVPAANGGAAITRYEYQLNSGSWTDTGTLGNSFVVNGLTNGTPYDVRVRAVNDQGNGAASTPVTAIPATIPGQPSITDVTRADQTLIATVTDATDGGAPILSWQYSTDGGTTWATANSTGNTLTITSLSSNPATRIANGTSYPITVRAVNSAGASLPSSVTTVGPSATPSAPVVALTSGDKTIRVSYTVASNGGSPITAVEYRLNGGTWFDAGTLASPFTIGGLVDGMHYDVEVRADNAIGAGAASIPASATPAGLPGAPTGVAAVSNTGSADVSWTAPSDNGGVPLTGYTATAYSSASSTTPIKSCTTTSTSCSISGLVNNTAYYVSVVATNSTGSSQESSPRVLVTPLTRPAAPTLTALTAGNSLLTLAFTAGSAGDKAITGYQYQLNGGSWVSVAQTTSPVAINGLTNGTAYTVALRAVSAAGVGATSSTLTATPYTFPDAPNPLTITANGTNASAVINWVAPNNNGSAITSYTATAFSAATAGTQVNTCTTTISLTCTITGLTNGTTYYVSVQAQNAAGLSVRSDPRVAVTPSLLPSAVKNVTAVAGNAQATINWTPGSTGASSISDYTIWYSSGGVYTQFNDGVSTSTSATVTGLTNGTPYTFEVYAVNGSGTGPVSAPSNSVTPLAPGTVPTTSTPVSTVDGFTFTITNYDAAATYTFPATNGATVARNGSAVTVSGLGAGQTSTVTVTAAKAGFTTASSAVVGSSLRTGIAPTFSTPVRTPSGYTFRITNYVPAAFYTFNATNGATVDVFGGSNVVVSGLSAGQSADVLVGMSHTGFTDISATETGSALDAGTAPALTNVTPTADGFTFDIANFQQGLVYSFDATNGGEITQAGSHVVVWNLVPGESSDVTVTANDPGVSIASADVSGTALLTGTVPTFTAPVSLAGGFAFGIANYSPDVHYTATTTHGVVTVNGSDVSVSGLDAGESATVTVLATQDGYTATSADQSGSALPAGVVPAFSTPVATADGFTFDITNYDPGTLYTLGASNGATASVDSDGHVTVTGLAPGDSSTVDVMASVSGSLSSFGSVTGTALLAGVTPTLSVPTSTADGFTFDITNYDPQTLYTFGATGGTVSVDSTGHVTVTGVAAGDSSTVTVTAIVNGSTDASDSVTGQALPAPVVTPTPTPTPTSTPTPTPTPSATPTTPASQTPSPTPSHTESPAVTPSPSSSAVNRAHGLVDTSTIGKVDTGSNDVPADSSADGSAADSSSVDGGSLADVPAPEVADAVKPGDGSVTLNGATAASTLSRTHSRLVLTSGGLVLELAAIVNGHEVMLPDGSVFTAVQGGHLHVWLKGFKAGTPATVWGFSTPVLLTKLGIGANHQGDAEFTLPMSMKPGNHMLVVSGTAANGKRAQMTVGLVITAAAPSLANPVHHPAGGSNWTWLWWLLGGLIALAGFIFFLIWRRRRDDEDEQTPATGKPALPSPSAMPQPRTAQESKPALPKQSSVRPRQPEADRDRDRLS